VWKQANHNTSTSAHSFGWGGASWLNGVPITGDWDGDGDTTVGIALLTPDGWVWKQANHNTSTSAYSFGWGGAAPADVTPITGDWDGDGDTTVGISTAARPSAGTPEPPPSANCSAVTESVPISHTTLAEGPAGSMRVHVCMEVVVEALLAAAWADGLGLSATSAWRSEEEQIALRRAHCGTSEYAIWEMPSTDCTPDTAIPGQSRHERGLAIDFRFCETRATACYRWLALHAGSFGLSNYPPEPWHWSLDGH
jgi:hypothetical protein